MRSLVHHVLHGRVCGSGLSGLPWVAVPRPASDDQRIDVTAAGHLNPVGVARCQAFQGYCLSQTVTLWTACPCAFVPLVVTVIVFPSSETTRVEVATTLSPFLSVRSMVRASMRLRATVSAFCDPVIG